MEVILQSMGIPAIPFLPSKSSLFGASSFQLSNSTANLKFAPIPTPLKRRNGGREAKFNYPKATSDEGETKEVQLPEEFEARLAGFRRKRLGKKAEMRRLRKAGMDPSKVKSRKETILLPPVPLKDPMSGGLKVELGFNAYSERINARFAALGLAALVLVELASGQSLFKYHAPGIPRMLVRVLKNSQMHLGAALMRTGRSSSGCGCAWDAFKSIRREPRQHLAASGEHHITKSIMFLSIDGRLLITK